MNTKGRIIVFDGLDCSFKETNANALAEYMESYEGRKVKVIHFPLYGQPSSWFVEQYLSGNFGKENEISSRAISMFYMLDMFAYMKLEGNKLLEEGTDLIFDRYWYCNIFYRLGKAQIESEDGFINEAEYEYITNSIFHMAKFLELPEPTLVIKMINDKETMIDYVKRKNSSNDLHESDHNLLRAVHDNFIKSDMKEYIGAGVVYGEVFVTDKNSKIRARSCIFGDVIDLYAKLYLEA